MKTNLAFDFTVNKEDNTIVVKREFDAPLGLVWDAWSKSEILDQWWAPKPYRVFTKSQDFKEGGTWLYAMISPEDEKHWCRADYTRIKDQENISWKDCFCDENGKPNEGKPQSQWTNLFSETDGTTTVDITLQHEKLEDLEAIIEMGFKEGFTMGMNNLDELLPTLKNK